MFHWWYKSIEVIYSRQSIQGNIFITNQYNCLWFYTTISAWENSFIRWEWNDSAVNERSGKPLPSSIFNYGDSDTRSSGKQKWPSSIRQEICHKQVAAAVMDATAAGSTKSLSPKIRKHHPSPNPSQKINVQPIVKCQWLILNMVINWGFIISIISTQPSNFITKKMGSNLLWRPTWRQPIRRTKQRIQCIGYYHKV